MKKQWVVIWIVAGLVSGWTPAWGAQDDAAQGRAAVLEPVVVTAGRIEEKKADVSTNITVITEQQIAESSARDLGDLLAKEGFMIREYPNSLTSVNIRGFRTDAHGNELSGNVLVLINGRRSGTGSLAQVSMDNVARVEVIRGPGSAQYGPLAMGGVINVITKQGRGKPTFYVEGALGSWEYHKAAVGLSGADDRFDFAFSASKAYQEDYNTAEGRTYLNTGYEAKNRISLNAGWTFRPHNRLGITYTDYTGEGIGSPDYLSANDADDYVDHAINSLEVTYDGADTKRFMIWNLHYFTGRDQYETFDPELYGNVHDYIKSKDRQGAQAQFTLQWDHAHLTTGLDWIYYAVSNANTIEGKENIYDNPAAFVMAKLKLLDDRLIFSLGGRQDWYTIDSDDGRSTDNDHWSTNLGVVYKFTPGFSVRANYAEGFKMPTADQLYMFDDYSAWGWGIWSGNENLKPEKSNTYEVGLDLTAATVSAGLTYFYTDYTDKISYREYPDEGLTRYENIDGAEIAGVEATLQWDMGARWAWTCEMAPYASFTYLTRYRDLETDENLQYTPQWTASYGLRFARPDAGLTVRLNFAFVDSQAIIDYEGTGDTDLKGYTVADLTLSKDLLDFDAAGRIRLNVDIRNLFNENYAPVQGYPGPGRSFYVGLKYIY